MSLRSLVEIVLHLESFRNVDLFFQGIYFTRSRIYYKRKPSKDTAISAMDDRDKLIGPQKQHKYVK